MNEPHFTAPACEFRAARDQCLRSDCIQPHDDPPTVMAHGQRYFAFWTLDR
jgi:hypothetical protein